MSELMVMKGSKFSEARLIKWLEEDGAVVCQVKRDEFRCIVDVNWEDADGFPKVYYTSPTGKPLYNLDCFDAYWLSISDLSGQRRFDTGVCINDSFDLTRRTVRASKKPYDLTGQTVNDIVDRKKGEVAFEYHGPLKARFWFYDLPELDLSYNLRRHAMGMLHKQYPEYTGLPETFVEDSITSVYDNEAEAVARGHEGLMVKRLDHKWEPRRVADSWMKLKPEDDIDGQIIGFTPGKDGFEGMVGSLQCKAEDGSTFSCSGFTLELRQAISADPDNYLGLWIVGKFMQRDSKGGYRHIQFSRFHDEKNL